MLDTPYHMMFEKVLETVEMDTLADKLSFGTLRQSDSLSPVTSVSSDVWVPDDLACDFMRFLAFKESI